MEDLISFGLRCADEALERAAELVDIEDGNYSVKGMTTRMVCRYTLVRPSILAVKILVLQEMVHLVAWFLIFCLCVIRGLTTMSKIPSSNLLLW
mgnify:CR=1 FL=1